MGGDAKCVQHKIVLPMYVSYTSIPTSTANTTMKSTKLLTNPYLDVTTTSTSAATYNLDKSINDHNNQSSTNNRNFINTTTNTNANTNNNTITTGDNTKSMGDKNAMTNFYSMSYNPYVNGSHIDESNGGDRNFTKKIMTNPMRSHNRDHVHKRNNGIACRNSSKVCAVGNSGGGGGGLMPRSIRYPDSDDTRSSSIDYNFNYVKFRSPLNSGCNMAQTQYRDSSTTSTLATDCSTFVRSSPQKKLTYNLFENDYERKKSLVLPKVHNHPNCQCAIQNCCPFAVERFEADVTRQSYGIYAGGMHDRASCYPYRRHYDQSRINESPPKYDHIDDFLMKRTFSHDRLFTQRHNGVSAARCRTRPKSYCSNVNHCPTQL